MSTILRKALACKRPHASVVVLSLDIPWTGVRHCVHSAGIQKHMKPDTSKWRRAGVPVDTTTRDCGDGSGREHQASVSVTNGSADLPPTNSGSRYALVEFTRRRVVEQRR